MSGHGWGPGDDRKRAIAELANAMQAVAAVVGEMSPDELEALFEKLDRMASIVTRTLAGRATPPSGAAAAAAVVRDIRSGLYPKGRV